MLKNIAIFSLLLIFLFPSAYYWGFLCGKKENDRKLYNSLLLDLSNAVLIKDAIDSGNAKEVLPLITASIESDFAQLIKLYTRHSFEEREHVRCAISRRIRELKRSNVILKNDANLEDYPIEDFNEYLNNNCLGDPSHNNWFIQKNS